MGVAVGIDYGIKRTGIAITDFDQIIASPYKTISTHRLDEFIQGIISNTKIVFFVIGMPVNLNNEITDITPHVKGFINRFEKQYPDIPIHQVDERFTSKISKRIIQASGIKKNARRNKALVDKISASILLQEFIDRKN